jgi:uncharacterized membrane-anchored protein YjiN (DUF445 family)
LTSTPVLSGSPPAPTGTPPALRSEDVRKRQLVVTKRRASALLAGVSVLFVLTTVWGPAPGSWLGYVQATAAASMVGGLADWFAVTALFRHPLGVPIPHTAIVVERKDQFARTLAEFIQESFVTPDVLAERVRAAGVVTRLADWLAEPTNAARLAAELADFAVAVADLLRDDDVHRALEGMVRERVDRVPLAPVAGRALRFLTENGRHDEALDAALRGLSRYLTEHHDDLRRRLGDQSPWWLPGAVEDRIFERLLDGAQAVLAEMIRDRGHDLRRQFEVRLAQLATDLETSSDLRRRGEELKRDLMNQPQLREWVAALWSDLKAQLRAQAANQDSELRRRLTSAVASAGDRLRSDPALGQMIEDAIESGLRYVAEHFDDEIAGVVSSTIGRWDAHETARRLELLLGPDLQYIRINGTVVGAAAGLALHAIAQALV